MIYNLQDPDFCDHGIMLNKPCFFCRRMMDAPRRMPERHRNPPPAPPRKLHGITIMKKRLPSRLPE